MNIIVTAGGTGGHIYPALAIINKFKEKEKDLNVLYIGTETRMEKDIIPKHNIKYIPIKIHGFSKTNFKRNIKNIFFIKKAYKECLKIIDDFKPDVVIGAGGYVTYPVLKAAKTRKVKTFIHEQNSIPGKTNKYLARGIDLVGISFKNSKVHFRGAKEVFYSGNPCESNAKETPVIKKETLGFTKNKKLIIVVAGSLGSNTLNEKFKMFLELSENEEFELLYITGKNHYDNFIKDFKAPSNVKVLPYLENLPGLMKEADLIISRAGASTISEILALELPSILIPSPYVANNHQYYNALDLVNLGVSTLVEEKKLTVDKLLIEITDILNNKNKLKTIKSNFKKHNTTSSSDLIYNKIMELLKK